MAFDMAPSNSAIFSFRSKLDSGLRDYLITGLNEADMRIGFNGGQINGPSLSSVPEPSTIALVGSALLGCLRLTRRRVQRELPSGLLT